MNSDLLSDSPRCTRGKHAVVYLFLFIALLAGTGGKSQDKWNATIRTGINLPVQDMDGIELKTGAGIDAMVGYRIRKHLLINLGWGWNHFSGYREAVREKRSYEETGYALGAQLVHPLSSGFHYLVGAHALYNQIEVGAGDGNIIYDSGHGWGWQADAGLGINLGNKFMLVPGIRYRSLNPKMQTDGMATTAELRYLSAGISIAFTL